MEKKTNVKALAAIFIFAISAMASNLTMGILANIIQSYPDVNPLIVQSVLTGPALVGTIFALMVGTLNQKVNAKWLMIFAQVTMLLYGMVFMFLGGNASIYVLIVASGLVGFNQGSMNTLVGIQLVNIVPDEGKRASLLGIVVAVMNIGGVIFTNVGGKIAAVASWQKAYVLFFYYIFAIVVEIFLLPNNEPEGKVAPAASGAEEVPVKVPVSVWLLSAHYFLFFLFLYVFGTNCSEYIQNTHAIGGPSEAAFAASTITIGGVVAGLLFGVYSKILGKLTVPVCMALSTIGLAIPVFVTTNVIGIYLAGFLCGFAMMGANPYIMGYLNKIAPGPAYGKAMGVFSGFMNAGMVVAIYVIAFLTKLAFGNGNNVDGKFIVAMVGMIITTATSPFIYLKKDK